jgi:hypothetical protein
MSVIAVIYNEVTWVLELILAITPDPSMQQRFHELFLRFILPVECLLEVRCGSLRVL